MFAFRLERNVESVLEHLETTVSPAGLAEQAVEWYEETHTRDGWTHAVVGTANRLARAGFHLTQNTVDVTTAARGIALARRDPEFDGSFERIIALNYSLEEIPAHEIVEVLRPFNLLSEFQA